jgi:site-specific recombinase XerD
VNGKAQRNPNLGSAKGSVPWNKGRELGGVVLTDAEADALITACSPVSATGLRNRALLTVMLRAGLRLDEALSLEPADIDAGLALIRVRHGKGNRPRTIGIDPGATATIQRWQDARRQARIRSRFLFCTLAGEKLSQQYVRAMLSRLKAKAGISKRVHPHGLRHTHASQAHMEGIPVGVIQKQLGHTRLTTTAIYLDHIAPATVIETMRRRVWGEPGRA